MKSAGHSIETEINSKFSTAHRNLLNGYGRNIPDIPVSCPSASKKAPPAPDRRYDELVARIKALEDRLAPEPIPTQPCDRIIRLICTQEGISKMELLGQRRQRPIVAMRHIGFYLSTVCTELTLPMIGLAWKKDHTSIMHGRDVIKRRRGREPALDKLLGWYEKRLCAR